MQDLNFKADPTDLSKFTVKNQQSTKRFSDGHLLHVLKDSESSHDRDENSIVCYGLS